MRTRAALSLGLIGLTAAIALTTTSPAHAEEPSSSDSLRSKATRRSDFTIGTSGAFGFGRASGYPNEIQKIDDKAYRSNTKLGIGSGGLLWLGVAFNDYLTFGFALGQLGLTGNDRTASAGVFGFHVDAYPLFDLNENLRDLAVFTNVGTGPLKITGGPEDADGGLLAYIEGGVAYERLRLWRFGIGPSVSLVHMWSDSAQLTGALIGARVALYTGP